MALQKEETKRRSLLLWMVGQLDQPLAQRFHPRRRIVDYDQSRTGPTPTRAAIGDLREEPRLPPSLDRLIAEFQGKPRLACAGSGGHHPDGEGPVVLHPVPEIRQHRLPADQRNRKRVSGEKCCFSSWTGT
jgi:hypothetical protein